MLLQKTFVKPTKFSDSLCFCQKEHEKEVLLLDLVTQVVKVTNE